MKSRGFPLIPRLSCVQMEHVTAKPTNAMPQDTYNKVDWPSISFFAEMNASSLDRVEAAAHRRCPDRGAACVGSSPAQVRVDRCA